MRQKLSSVEWLSCVLPCVGDSTVYRETATPLAVVSEQQGEEKNGNLTALARTDMPANPGKKGGQSTSRVRPERLPVDDVTKREYASKRHSYATPPNNELFLLKQITNRIKICQGCRTSIRGRGGRIENPPFDFCVSRMEKGLTQHPKVILGSQHVLAIATTIFACAV